MGVGFPPLWSKPIQPSAVFAHLAKTMFTFISVAASLTQAMQDQDHGLNTRTPALLVTDIGSDPDDIMALLVLLASDKFQVEAIITTGGDTINRARVAARWVQLSGTKQRPSIVPDRSEYQAKNPCNLPAHILDTPEPTTTEEDAAGLILRKAAAHGQSLGILCIGQMTSLAEAVRREPNRMRDIGFLGIQGQLVEDKEGRIRPDLAAFNLKQDKEASERARRPRALSPCWQACCLSSPTGQGRCRTGAFPAGRHQIEPAHLQESRLILLSQFLQGGEEGGRGREGGGGHPGPPLHVANPYDPLLVLSIIRPDLFELKRHGKRQQHTSVGNFKEAPGVIDPSKVRGVLKEYLNKHF